MFKFKSWPNPLQSITMTSNNKKQKKQVNLGNHGKRKQHELSFVLGQLDALINVLSFGYSEGNWTVASRIIGNLQGHLLQSDRETLATIWRDAFTDHNPTKTTSEIESLKTRLSSVS